MPHKHVDLGAAMRSFSRDKVRLRRRGTKRRGDVASRHHGHEAAGAAPPSR